MIKEPLINAYFGTILRHALLATRAYLDDMSQVVCGAIPCLALELHINQRFLQKPLRVLTLAWLLWAHTASATLNVYEFEDAQDAARFQHLITTLRCPKCQNNDLADSNAPLARDMKNKIYQQIQAGKSDAAIIDYFVSRYGRFIVYDPKVFALWGLPVVLVFLGGGWALWRVKKAPNAGVAADFSVQATTAPPTDERRKNQFKPRYSNALVVVFGVLIGAGLTWQGMKSDGVFAWRAAANRFDETLLAGIFDRQVMQDMLLTSAPTSRRAYCLLMQRKVQGDFPKNPDALVQVAECHLALMNADFQVLAEEALAHALRESPDHLRGNYVLAQLAFLQEQRLSTALEARLVTLTDAHPDSVDMLYLLALNRLAKGDYTAAKGYIKRLEPLAKENPTLRQALDALAPQIDALWYSQQ